MKSENQCSPADEELQNFQHWKDPGLTERGFERWAEIRRKGVSVFTTNARTPGREDNKNWWYLLDYEDVRNTFMSHEIFSSSKPHPSPSDQKLIPVGLDPPEHGKYRKLLIPPFALSEMKRRETEILGHCRALIEAIAPRGECDFASDFAFRFPTAIFVKILGLPLENLSYYVGLVQRITTTPPDEDLDGSIVKTVEAEIKGVFGVLLEERRRQPADDMMSYLLAAEIDGAPISEDDLLSTCMLLLRAGVETVAAQLGHMFYHLAQHPNLRERLVTDPGSINKIMEEMLRFYTPGNSVRTAAQDVEVGGCPIKAGDRVIMPRAACHRDPKVFSEPDTFDPDRRENYKHIAFGIGIHACLGAHLARYELRMALEEWHRLIPNYRIKIGTTPRRMVTDIIVAIDRLELEW